MTRDEIIRMARESGLAEFYGATEENIERFAALVAAAERKACAKVCVCEQDEWGSDESGYYAAKNCADAIRARGQQ